MRPSAPDDPEKAKQALNMMDLDGFGIMAADLRNLSSNYFYHLFGI